MKVLLVNISLRPESDKILMPIGLGYIATAIDNAGYDMEIIDIDACKYTDKELDKLNSGLGDDELIKTGHYRDNKCAK